jgi:hypothetical protein
MEQRDHLAKAREIARRNAANTRANTVFVLEYRGGGGSELKGYTALAKALSIKETSIPVLVSQGGGASFTLMRTNPLTGEPDIVQVTRVVPAKLLRMRKPRGRPPSRLKLAIQAERELEQLRQFQMTVELREQRDRHKSCRGAKTVPKGRNRRTDDAAS